MTRVEDSYCDNAESGLIRDWVRNAASPTFNSIRNIELMPTAEGQRSRVLDGQR